MSGDRVGPFDSWLQRFGTADIPASPRQSHCGGAYLFMTREEAEKAVAGGVKFDADIANIPNDGSRESIRVRCRDEVMVKNGVTYALCSRCCGFELAIRTRLRAKKEEASKLAKGESGKSRRGSFDR